MLDQTLSEVFTTAPHKRAIFAIDEASLFHALQLGSTYVHQDISALRGLRYLALGPWNQSLLVALSDLWLNHIIVCDY